VVSILDSDIGKERACVILGNASLRSFSETEIIPPGYSVLSGLDSIDGAPSRSALFVPLRSIRAGLLDAGRLLERNALAGIGILFDVPRGFDKFGGEKRLYDSDSDTVVSHSLLRKGPLLPIRRLNHELYDLLVGKMSDYVDESLLREVLLLTNQRARRELIHIVGSVGEDVPVHVSRRADSLIYRKDVDSELAHEDSVLAVPCPGVIAATHCTFARIFDTCNVRSNWDVGNVVGERALRVGGNFAYDNCRLRITERRFGKNKCVRIVFPDNGRSRSNDCGCD